jgi:hypothetical protein
MVVIGCIGFFYIASRSGDEILRKGLKKSAFLRYVVFAWLFAIFVCFSGTALIFLWTRSYVASLNFGMLGLIISLVFTLLLAFRCFFFNALYKKVEKYYVSKD